MIDCLTVRANTIDEVHFTYECPLCPKVRNKPRVHRHGSGNDFRHRTECRSPHCEVAARAQGIFEVKIVIDDETSRLTNIRYLDPKTKTT